MLVFMPFSCAHNAAHRGFLASMRQNRADFVIQDIDNGLSYPNDCADYDKEDEACNQAVFNRCCALLVAPEILMFAHARMLLALLLILAHWP